MRNNYIFESVDKTNFKSDKPLSVKIGKTKKTKKKKKRHKKIVRNKWQKNTPTRYKEYIKSKYWERRKISYWDSHKKECCVCHSTENVQLHHKVYNWQRYGNEPDEHLAPLCMDCHGQFHYEYGVKGNMEIELVNFALNQLAEQESKELQELLSNFG